MYETRKRGLMMYERRVAKVAPDHLLTNIDGQSISAE